MMLTDKMLKNEFSPNVREKWFNFQKKKKSPSIFKIFTLKQPTTFPSLTFLLVSYKL